MFHLVFNLRFGGNIVVTSVIFHKHRMINDMALAMLFSGWSDRLGQIEWLHCNCSFDVLYSRNKSRIAAFIRLSNSFFVAPFSCLLKNREAGITIAIIVLGQGLSALSTANVKYFSASSVLSKFRKPSLRENSTESREGQLVESLSADI